MHDSATQCRVLVVAYYFPPMGLSGVQRISKFVKYLPDFGWTPTVLTTEPGGYFAFDESLLNELTERQIEIHRTPTKDPTRLFRKQQTVQMPTGLKRRLLNWLSAFFFIPDNKIGWYKTAVAQGMQVLASGDYDAIMASAPPYTGLLVGAELSRRTGIPLVLDLRDDWLENPRHIYPTPWHKKRHRKLEQRTFEQSSHILTINRRIKEQVLGRFMGAQGYNHVSILSQGFDPADFKRAPVGAPSSVLRFHYSGIFYGAQTPEFFLKGLAEALSQRPELREDVQATFAGFLPESAQDLVQQLDLESLVTYMGYLPHTEAVAALQTADVLWMTVGRQKGGDAISTGKLFEYIGAEKPILGLVPKGMAEQALTAYGAGQVVPPDEVQAIAAAILRYHDQWKAQQLPTPDPDFVAQHNRRLLTKQLAAILASVIRID